MKTKKTVKSIIALCLAVVCCLALAACGNSGDGNAAATAPSAIYVGGSTAYSEPAPGYALTDTTKVYASGDIYNMYTKKESMKTEVWSDDSSLTDAEKKDLMDTFGISNVKIEVNAADNTFEVFTFNTTGLVDMESSVW